MGETFLQLYWGFLKKNFACGKGKYGIFHWVNPPAKAWGKLFYNFIGDF